VYLFLALHPSLTNDSRRHTNVYQNGASRHGHTLSGDARTFNPRSPLNHLTSHSDADTNVKTSNGLPGPLLVNGSTPSQQPIGTRGENVTQAEQPLFFTTDIGPAAAFQGSHYFKISFPKGSGATWDQVNSEVSSMMSCFARVIRS
jgi:hypothetical protein